jgi:hypothetical protein
MMQKGGGSFTHVIKASEPVVAVILGLIINKAVPKPLTALSLLPITYGINITYNYQFLIIFNINNIK